MLTGTDFRPSHPQIRDLNKGTFGKVQLAFDNVNKELVAIKFVERGEKVIGPWLFVEDPGQWPCFVFPGTYVLSPFQITKYVKAEILNQKRLQHPHIVELREVSVQSAPTPVSLICGVPLAVWLC